MKCTYSEHKLLRLVDFKERKKIYIYLSSNVTDVLKSMKQKNVLLICRKCGKLNHFEIACRNMPRNHNKNTHSHFEVVSEDECDSENVFCIDAFITNQTKNDDFKIEVEINKNLVQLKLDTGAQCNVISKHLYKSLGGRHLYKSRVNITYNQWEKLT